jgi:serine/threonine-protein kinase
LPKALNLHGIYRSRITVTGANAKPREDLDYSVDTICLRDGDHCLSRFLEIPPGTRHELLTYETGGWKRNEEEESPCPAGGTTHTLWTANFHLPDPAPEPIIELKGSGKSEVSGSACTGGYFYDEVFTRIGNDPIPR